jgi:hypothetical protein
MLGTGECRGNARMQGAFHYACFGILGYCVMMKRFLVWSCLMVLASTSALGQKMKLLSGSLKPLKGQKSYDIQFTYDSMTVGGAGMSEKSYLRQKKTDWEMKEPGRGSDFVEKWFADRERLYEPSFIKKFEHYSKLKLEDTAAKYTLLVKTKNTEGGWSAGVVGHPGEISGEMLVVESADKINVIAKILFFEFTGKVSAGGDFDMTQRIRGAYEVTGRWLGDFVRRKTK